MDEPIERKLPLRPKSEDWRRVAAETRTKRLTEHAKRHARDERMRAKPVEPERKSKKIDIAVREDGRIDHPLLHSNEDISTLLLGLTAGRNARTVRLGKHLFQVPSMIDIDTRYAELHEDLERLAYSPQLLASCKRSFKILKFWVERGDKALEIENERVKFIPNSALTDRHFEETIRSYEHAGKLARIIAEQYGSGRRSSPAI